MKTLERSRRDKRAVHLYGSTGERAEVRRTPRPPPPLRLRRALACAISSTYIFSKATRPLSRAPLRFGARLLKHTAQPLAGQVPRGSGPIRASIIPPGASYVRTLGKHHTPSALKNIQLLCTAPVGRPLSPPGSCPHGAPRASIIPPRPPKACSEPLVLDMQPLGVHALECGLDGSALAHHHRGQPGPGVVVTQVDAPGLDANAVHRRLLPSRCLERAAPPPRLSECRELPADHARCGLPQRRES